MIVIRIFKIKEGTLLKRPLYMEKYCFYFSTKLSRYFVNSLKNAFFICFSISR